MSSNGAAQAFEAPFNFSDLTNFDFDFGVADQGTNLASETLVAEHHNFVSTHDPNASFVDVVDADFAGIFQLPDGSNALGDGFNAPQTVSEDSDGLHASQISPTVPILNDGFSALKLGPKGFAMTDASENFVDDNAGFGDFIASHPASEDSGMTDTIQKSIETDAPLDDSTVSEQAPFAHGVDPAALELSRSPLGWVTIPMQVSADQQSPAFPQIMQDHSSWVPSTLDTQQEPSKWAPVSPQLQTHLNMVYASQLIRNLETSNPAPVLYFPAQEAFACHTSSIHSQPGDVHPQHEYPESSLPRTEIAPIDRSLMTHASTELPPQDCSSNRTYGLTSPMTDEAPDAEDLALTTTKKRAFDASDSDSERVPKRTRTALAKTSSAVAKDDDSDDDDEPLMTRKRTAQRNPCPIIAKTDKPDDESSDEFDDSSVDEHSDSDSSSIPSATAVTRRRPSALPTSKSTAKKGQTWRYEQAREVRLREQRKREWNRRRADPSTAKGKAPNRKMQRLLAELEDSEEFAEAHGFKVGASVDDDGDRYPVPKRPVRKGARKNYTGQE